LKKNDEGTKLAIFSLNQLHLHDFLCPGGDTETVIDPVPRDPDDILPGTKKPDVLFFCNGEFAVNEIIAQFLLFIQTVRIKCIPFFPSSQNKGKGDFLQVECGCVF
jgi:hypothetical protein